MVSSGTVDGNLGSFQSLMKSYQSEIDGSLSGWNGISHNNFVSKAEGFISEFRSSIESELNAFSAACSLYQEYLTAKKNLEYARENYDIAVANNESTSQFQSDINRYSNQVETLKNQINSNLESARSVKLTASSTSFAGASNAAAASSDVIQSVITWAETIANDSRYGYSLDVNKRWGSPSYDCSSFVISAYEAAGIPVKSKYNASFTGNMKSAFLKTGQFEWIPGDPDVEDLQVGDILLNETHHTEIYYGDGKKIGAHSNFDKVDGDSGGMEICVKKYSSYPWDGVLRYIGDK